jgi:hypothetical protein
MPRIQSPNVKITAKAIVKLRAGTCTSPEEAWISSAREVYRGNPPEKSCGKRAFIGLCERGLVLGVEEETQPDEENVNGAYAEAALKLLRDNPQWKDEDLEPGSLWKRLGEVPGLCRPNTPNGQMAVVLALWPEEVDNSRL